MTKEQLLKNLFERLKEYGFNSARFEANQILNAVCSNAFLDTVLTVEQIHCAEEMLSRRLNNEPLQYILGEWEFYGLPFKVGTGVLIPRQDTEILVETALPIVKSGNKKVIDLCAGSGCIGITLAKLGGADVTLFEKSDEAIGYLKQNIALNNVDATLVQYDVLNAPPKISADVIVSNPPYIRSDVVETLSAEVKKEPRMALDGGEDGLVFYRHIATKWQAVLKTGGYLIFEIGYDQSKDVTEIMKNAGYSNVTCKKDLCGMDRVVLGRR